MKEKFQKLMQYKQLTSSRLAELLGVQASGISHILNKEGRKPSYELLQKILLRFPEINPDWLILDSPNMLRPGYEAESGTDVDMQGNTVGLGNNTLFDSADNSAKSSQSFFEVNSSNSTSGPSIATPNSTGEKSNFTSTNVTPSSQQKSAEFPFVPSAHFSAHGRVKRVIVLFEDRTFESYEMAQ